MFLAMAGLSACPKQQAVLPAPAINTGELAVFVNMSLPDSAERLEACLTAFDKTPQDNSGTDYITAVYEAQFRDAAAVLEFVAVFRKSSYKVVNSGLRDSIDYAFIDRSRLQLITLSRQPDPDNANLQKFRIIVLEPGNDLSFDGMIESMRRK
jgi:lipocalin